MSENVITAIIAGLVSIVISGIAGIYTIFKNKRRFEDLKKELITRSDTENFITAKIKYLDNYREFKAIFVESLKRNPENRTETLQSLINFYAEKAKDYYVRNRSFLKSKELENLLDKINASIDSKTLNNKDNQEERRDFGENLLSFIKKLNEQSLK